MLLKTSDNERWIGLLSHEIGTEVSVKFDVAGPILLIPCSVCHEVKELLLGKRLPPEMVRKRLKNKGWRLGRHVTCDHCVKTRPNAHRENTIMTRESGWKTSLAVDASVSSRAPVVVKAKEEVKKVDNMKELASLFVKQAEERKLEQPVVVEEVFRKAEPVAVEPIEVDKQAHRKMMLLLEEYFSDEGSCYKIDNLGVWTDQRIAEGAKVPVEYVKENREKWFGHLHEPKEFEDLQEQLLQLQQDYLDLGKRMKDMEAKMSEAAKKMGII